MAVRLTDKQVSALRAEPGKRLDVFDLQEPGLLLRVSDSGRRTWFFRYRIADGRQPRMKLGTYPTTTIVEARRKAHDARRIVEAGGDPAGVERVAKLKAQTQEIKTFGDLCEAYLTASADGSYKARQRQKSATTIESERRLYNRHIKAAFHTRPFAEIGRQEIKALERGMIGKGIKTQTNHVHALVRQVLSFAVEQDLIPFNFAKSMSTPAPKNSRKRILSADELKAFWLAIQDASDLKDEAGNQIYVGQVVSIALRLTAILLQRRVEVAGMEVAELDLAEAVWVIPETRTKNGLPHAVPLPPEALKLIRHAIQLNTRGDSPFVFPSPRSRDKSISPDALTRAMGSVMKALGFALAGPHDLRRTGSTALHAPPLKFLPFDVSQVLNHVTDTGGGSSTTQRHYNLYRYLPEKRAALEAWEALLRETVGEPSLEQALNEAKPK